MMEKITPHNASAVTTLLLIGAAGGTVFKRDGQLYVRGIRNMSNELRMAIDRNRAEILRVAVAK